MKKNISKQKAFTIIETLMTLLAISLMIAGPLTFMYRSYKYSEFSISRAVSLGLAQEGLELATSIRNASTTTFQAMASKCTSGCWVDWDSSISTPSYDTCDMGDANNEGDCKLWKKNDGSQLYRVSGDTETDFSRAVKISSNGTGGYMVESTAWSYVDEIRVESKLSKMMFDIKIK
jgi:type II secretory pathway pseudopilin PulG